MSTDDMHRFKIILIGNTSVGKSAVLQQFIENRFTSTSTTIGVDYGSREVEVPNYGPVKLQIWDTAGQEMYRSIVQSYFRSTGGIVLMYDMTDINSVDDLEQWQEIIKEKTTPGIPVILVGNKSDLFSKGAHLPIKTKADDFAKRYGYTHLLCSAKANAGVQDIFVTLGQEIFSFVERRHKDGVLENCGGIILHDKFPPECSGMVGKNKVFTSSYPTKCCN